MPESLGVFPYLVIGLSVAMLVGASVYGLREWLRHHRRKAELAVNPVVDLTYFHHANQVFDAASHSLDEMARWDDPTPGVRPPSASRPR